MKHLSKILISFIFLVFVSSSAWATYMADITYDYTRSGSDYTFMYTVHNTSDGTSSGNLDFFRIFFDADSDWSLYKNLTWVDALGWDNPQAVDYDPSFGWIPGEINTDGLPVGEGIAQGDSLGRFVVTFTYTGLLNPEDQEFNFEAYFSEVTGAVEMATGQTSFVDDNINPVPEPASMLLIGSGLFGLLPFFRRKEK